MSKHWDNTVADMGGNPDPAVDILLDQMEETVPVPAHPDTALEDHQKKEPAARPADSQAIAEIVLTLLLC